MECTLIGCTGASIVYVKTKTTKIQKCLAPELSSHSPLATVDMLLGHNVQYKLLIGEVR